MTDNDDSATIREDRGNPYHDSKGRFTFSIGKTQKKMSAKERTIVSHGILTDHPNLTPEDGRRSYEYGDYYYVFETVEPGTYNFGVRLKISPRNNKRINAYMEIYRHA